MLKIVTFKASINSATIHTSSLSQPNHATTNTTTSTAAATTVVATLPSSRASLPPSRSSDRIVHRL
ncbi:hypothetical protein E2C01_068927 [Portunus trituberculatus]|uniref:Uncharacterized protein n=1 Tax=Portunus trituberculatus TaxID=210409 RepID=A0A5B7I1G3_PORTR|nr:hypothetical protein [Portunus trituberculatus]